MTIRFDKSMADVAGTKPQRLRLGDWYCEPPTWAKVIQRRSGVEKDVAEMSRRLTQSDSEGDVR